MADATGIGKILRDLTQAYLDGLSKIGSTIGDLAKSRMPDAERQVEHWIGVARAAKDGYVAAIDEGFATWERRVRQTFTRKASSEQKSTANVFEGWVDEWRKANETFMQSIRSSGLGEEAMKQTRELRKAFDDGMKNLQKLWQSASKDDK